MTALTKEMIDAFPIANLHVHLPGVISAKTALELGLRNNLCRIENGKIVSDDPLPIQKEFFDIAQSEGKKIYYKYYSEIFAEGYEVDSEGRVSNLEYNVPKGRATTFDRFDQIMGLVQAHKYSYYTEGGGYLNAVGGIQKPEDLRFVLKEYLKNCEDAKVKYVELKQNIYLSRILFPRMSVSDGQQRFFEILREAQEEFAEKDISLYFVQCYNKSSGLKDEIAAQERSINAVKDLVLANELFPDLFVGIDSAGNEKVFLAHPRFQAAAYKIAGSFGLKLDCHAAEAGHAQMLIDSVDHLGVKMVGHGIQVVESDAARKFAIDRDITFFVCPTMNMFLGTHLSMSDGEKVSVENLWQHPVFDMLRTEIDGKKLKVTLATDNPDLGGVTFKEMLLQLSGLRTEVTGHPPEGFKPLNAEELYECSRNQIDAIPSVAERIKYSRELDSWAKLSGLEINSTQPSYPRG